MKKPNFKNGLYISEETRESFCKAVQEVCTTPETYALRKIADWALESPNETFVIEIERKK